MPTVQTVLDALERLAPASTAFEWDRIGLQVGDSGAEVRRAAVALDPSAGLIEFALTQNAELLVCHHPVIWEPLKSLALESRPARLVAEMIRADLAFVAAHTNWDAAPGGINGRLAALLGLAEVVPFGSGSPESFVKIAVFAPEEAAPALIDAMSEAGAGTIGLYRRCAFFSEGTGTYLGTEGAKPHLGQAGRIEEVKELRIEMRVSETRLAETISALRRVHPYEEPAYDVYPLQPAVERPMGQVGRLPTEMSLVEFQRALDARLETRSWAFGNPEATIRRVAVCGGAADDEWRAARLAGADAFVTGEVKHHNAVEAAEAGLAILAAGHFATEHPGCAALVEALSKEVPGVEFRLFEPEVGRAGRAIGR